MILLVIFRMPVAMIVTQAITVLVITATAAILIMVTAATLRISLVIDPYSLLILYEIRV